MALEDIAPGVFGQFPDMSGSLSPEQIQSLQNNAAKQALLASAVTMLGMSGNQRVPVSTGQALGAALGAGSGAYQGSFDNTLKQMIAGQQMQDYRTKADARKRYQQAIAGATTRQPIAMPMAQGQGSQLQMLRDQTLDFGVEGDATTARALMSNPNLPMREVVDTERANQAALDFVRQEYPDKYLEFIAKTAKTDKVPDKIQQYEFAKTPEGGNYKGSFPEFLNLSKPGGVSLTLNTEKSFGGELGTQLAKQDAGKFEAAVKAPQMLSNINATRDILNSGNVITGAFADEKLNVARVGQALGVTGKNTNEMVANTQALFASRAGAVLDSIRASGLGAGQGFSNADRDYLEKAKMGGIKFSPEAMKNQLDIEEKVARATAGAWNERFDQMPDSAKKPLGLNKIELPAAQATGTTTGVKKYDPISRTVK
jgi:hypothetical protein